MTDGIELAEAITMVRRNLIEARAQGASEGIQFPVSSLTIELKVVATRTADGKAGFKVPIVNAELGGSISHESEWAQTITVTLGAPVDGQGRPALVADVSTTVKG